MDDRFARMQLLLGDEATTALGGARVAVFGVGGVGGFAIEALARCGVGALDITDPDVVGSTNINRQIIALTSTIGRPKVEVMAERIADINPTCSVTARQEFYLPATAPTFDFDVYDYVVDAVDTVTGKLQIIERAHEAGVPVISSMGAANKMDPCAFRVDAIENTTICPLARIIRKECRKRGIGSFKAVYSTEPPRRPYADDPRAREEIEAGRLATGRRDIPGSLSFVPSVAGLILAGEVIHDLIDSPMHPRHTSSARDDDASAFL